MHLRTLFSHPFRTPHGEHSARRHAMAHGAGHGGGHHAGGRRGGGGFGGDDDGLTRGRKFSADDLQILLLALLAEAPSHGYELIKALQSRSSGYYTPSPGVVYPALTYLEEIGYASVETISNKKCYQLTDAGQAYLASQAARAELMLAKLGHLARKLEHMRRAMAGEGEDAGAGWLAEFAQARRSLKEALLLRDQAGPDEQRRIAAILEKARQEIEAVAHPSHRKDARP